MLEVLENFELLCDNCSQDNSLHRSYFYHKDGYVECKTTQNKSLDRDENNVYLSAYCKECEEYIQEHEICHSGMLEYSFGLFLKQFFYNRKLLASCKHTNYNIQRIFEYGNLCITFEYVFVKQYNIDLYDLRQIYSNSEGSLRDKIIENVITNFIEVYGGLESMLSLLETIDINSTKNNLQKARSLLKKILKNFKVIIFDTLKDGSIKDYLGVWYLIRFIFLNILSLAFMIKELYWLNLMNSKFDF